MSFQQHSDHFPEPEEFGDSLAISDYLTLFTYTFSDPVESQPVDQGEYVWTVREWTTEDAIDHLFPSIEPSIFTELADKLNSESSSWVMTKDLER